MLISIVVMKLFFVSLITYSNFAKRINILFSEEVWDCAKLIYEIQ